MAAGEQPTQRGVPALGLLRPQNLLPGPQPEPSEWGPAGAAAASEPAGVVPVRGRAVRGIGQAGTEQPTLTALWPCV